MNSKKYILALDQGTTSSRAILFDREGRAVASAQKELTQYYPQPGWVEHDPKEIWQSQLGVAQEALRKAGATTADVAAIGLTNQRETTVLWDRKTGEPVGRAIVWQDRRTASVCDALTAQGAGPTIQRKTGLLIDPYFSATKIAWLLDHQSSALGLPSEALAKAGLPSEALAKAGTTRSTRARAEAGELAFGTIDSWLVWNLTGGRRHISEVSNASRTSLLNIQTLEWDDELLTLFGVPRSLMPEIVASSGPLAETDPALFGASVPITGIAGDQQAATFGQACLKPGMVKNTYGTGLFLLMNTGASPIVSHHRLLATVGWRLGGKTSYALEGSVFMGGATIQWLRDGLGIISSADQIGAVAAGCASSEGVMLVPAFAGLGAPYWDPYARGTILGVTRGTGRAQLARAALDAIALQTVDVLHAMEADSGIAVSELRVDGGASRCDLLMQIQADLAGTTVVRPEITETTALGAAYLAGLEVGFWSGLDEISHHWRASRRFEPAISDAERASRLARWHQAVERARGWEQPVGGKPL